MGCAAALVAGLTCERSPFGAVVGMCGWLPFGRGVERAVRADEADDGVGGG
jgi:hypothetical protein